MAGSVVMILIDGALKRAGGAARLPVLAVGIGLYLPPTVGVTLAVGAVLGWAVERHLRGRPDAERAGRQGVLIASGLIVGESLVGVAMAAVIGGTGSRRRSRSWGRASTGWRSGWDWCVCRGDSGNLGQDNKTEASRGVLRTLLYVIQALRRPS